MLNELYAYVVPTPGGIEKPGAVKNAATRVFYFRIHYVLLLLLRDARFFLRRRFLVSFFRKKKKNRTTRRLPIYSLRENPIRVRNGNN